MKNLISQVLKEFLKVFMVFFLMLAAIVGLVKLYLHKDYDSSKNIGFPKRKGKKQKTA